MWNVVSLICTNPRIQQYLGVHLSLVGQCVENLVIYVAFQHCFFFRFVIRFMFFIQLSVTHVQDSGKRCRCYTQLGTLAQLYALCLLIWENWRWNSVEGRVFAIWEVGREKNPRWPLLSLSSFVCLVLSSSLYSVVFSLKFNQSAINVDSFIRVLSISTLFWSNSTILNHFYRCLRLKETD